MKSLGSMIPDPATVLALEPEQLAGVLLAHLNSLPADELVHLNRYNFFLSQDNTFREYAPGRKTPVRQPKPGELLFEFVRESDRAPMSCELRFHGESYGWEAQILERGELFASRGPFPTRALAVQWADLERQAMERPS